MIPSTAEKFLKKNQISLINCLIQSGQTLKSKMLHFHKTMNLKNWMILQKNDLKCFRDDSKFVSEIV